MNIGLILSIIAGLTTLCGLAFTINFKDIKKIDKIVNISLSMTFIVMILISIFDIFIEGIKYLQNRPFLSILIYIITIYIILYIITNITPKNNQKSIEKGELYNLGIFNMIALLLHNIPEGVITCIISNYDIKLGIKLTLSIIMHNIPEGISIAVPIYYSTKKRRKAFIYTFIAALGEIFGATTSLLIFNKFKGDIYHIGYVLIFVAILMISISIYKIYPQIKTNNKLDIIIGLMIGSIIFILNIILT